MKTSLLSLALLLITTGSFAQSTNTAEVEAALKDFIVEYNKSPRDFFKSRLTSDFRYTDGNGSFSFRPDILKNSEGRPSTYSEVSNVKAFRVGDLGIVSGIRTTEGRKLAFTYTLEKQNGKWMFAASQQTPVQPIQTAGTDEASIKKVIEDEHNASRARNLDKLLACYARSEDAVFGFIPGLGMVRSYDAMAKGLKTSIEKNPKPLEGTTAISDYRIRQQGNSAFVSSIAISTLPDGSQIQTNKAEYLEKQNGEWKIVGNLYSNEPVKKP